MQMIRALLTTTVFLSAAAGNAFGAELVSRNAGGAGPGNGPSQEARVAASGRYVVFVSAATNLVAGASDGNASEDVFRRDLVSGSTQLVSVNRFGTATGNGGSRDARVSADGRFVAFTSSATDLVALPDNNAAEDVFVRDLVLGTTIRVSTAHNGTDSGNGGSFANEISANGNTIVFSSFANNLAATPDTYDDEENTDLFAYQRDLATTTMVNINAEGSDSGGGATGTVCITADGRHVAFQSYSNGILPAIDSNFAIDVFRRDLTTATTVAVSVNMATQAAGSGEIVGHDCINDAGTLVAFHSSLSLATIPSAGGDDVFVRNLATNTTELISVAANGQSGGSHNSEKASISADGRYVAFISWAADLVEPPTLERQIFLRDRLLWRTRLVSRSLMQGHGNGMADVEQAPALSRDAHWLAFSSRATDLVTVPDTSGSSDTFIAELRSGSIGLVSITAAGDATSPMTPGTAGVALDGTVAFNSLAGDLVVGDGNGMGDVFALRNVVFDNGFD